ncbi:hypothetical protein KUCAC02_022930, partial [Chaenocephalus aceratus]
MLVISMTHVTSVNGAYCSEKDLDTELGDAEGTLMRCGQSLLVGGHLGGLYTQSLHCDRPTPDLILQDGPHQDTRSCSAFQRTLPGGLAGIRLRHRQQGPSPLSLPNQTRETQWGYKISNTGVHSSSQAGFQNCSGGQSSAAAARRRPSVAALIVPSTPEEINITLPSSAPPPDVDGGWRQRWSRSRGRARGRVRSGAPCCRPWGWRSSRGRRRRRGGSDGLGLLMSGALMSGMLHSGPEAATLLDGGQRSGAVLKQEPLDDFSPSEDELFQHHYHQHHHLSGRSGAATSASPPLSPPLCPRPTTCTNTRGPVLGVCCTTRASKQHRPPPWDSNRPLGGPSGVSHGAGKKWGGGALVDKQ